MGSDLIINSDIDLYRLELILTAMPQVEYETVEELKNGFYTREVHIPKHTYIIGHKHTEPYYEVCKKGKILIYDVGSCDTVEEGMSRIAEAGSKKAGYTLEDTIWQTVHKTDAKTKSEAYERTIIKDNPIVKDSKEDFSNYLKENNITEGDIKEYMDKAGYIQTKHDNYYIGLSHIHNNGIFVRRPFKRWELIGLCIFNGKRTDLARFINHSQYNNVKIQRIDDDTVALIATKNLFKDEELYLDYRQNIEELV